MGKLLVFALKGAVGSFLFSTKSSLYFLLIQSHQELLESNRPSPDEGKPRKSVEDRDYLIFELIKRRWDSISQHTSTLDTKAASLVGFVSIVVGLVVGGGTFEVSVIASSYLLYITYFASIAFLLSSIFFGLKAFKEKRNYAIVVPDIRVLLEKYTKANVSYSEVL